MNIDDTIFLASYEKLLNSVWLENHSRIFGTNNININEEAQILNIKYDKTAEVLREYKYYEKLNNLVKGKDIEPNTALELREALDIALNNVLSDNIESLEEGYNVLSNLYVMLESNILTENRRQAMAVVAHGKKLEDQPKKVQEYIMGQKNAHEYSDGDYPDAEARKKDMEKSLVKLTKQARKKMIEKGNANNRRARENIRNRKV